MHWRTFGRTGIEVSEIGVGTWQLGGADWGDVSEEQSLDTLAAAVDAGVTFVDTADIYGAGRSETLIGQFLKGRSDRDRLFIATKLGRGPNPGWPGNFEREKVFNHTEASLRRLGVDVLDLTQTHCIPKEVMAKGDVFEHLAALQQQGKIKAFGASVESVEEAFLCLEHEGVASLQIIFRPYQPNSTGGLSSSTRTASPSIFAGLSESVACASGFPLHRRRSSKHHARHGPPPTDGLGECFRENCSELTPADKRLNPRTGLFPNDPSPLEEGYRDAISIGGIAGCRRNAESR